MTTVIAVSKDREVGVLALSHTVLKNIEISILQNAAILPKRNFFLPQIHLFKYVQCCCIHSIQKFETTEMVFNRKSGKQNVVHLHNRAIHRHLHKEIIKFKAKWN